MGRKHREERREKREDFVAKRSHQKRKSTLLAVGILGLIGLIVGYASFTFVTTPVGAPGSPPGAGILGDEHEHASVLVRIFGDKFDFAATTYQIKSSWIHFEESDGNTVHRHSSGVTLDYLFGTLGLDIDEDCYIFGDGRQFCTNEDYSLKYFINGDRVNSINDYVVQNDDRILISYGSETEDQIADQMNELYSQIISD